MDKKEKTEKDYLKELVDNSRSIMYNMQFIVWLIIIGGGISIAAAVLMAANGG
ncbi:MAG: hypothetical protein ACI9N9_000028 [Enterobacterales bacterium]|jgi:hypothetical protein